MAESKEKLFSEFPPISTEEWMAKVTADLKGADFTKKLVWRTNEGFSVKPMYRAEDIKDLKTTDSLPGQFPYVRGTKVDNNWLVRQEIKVKDVKKANAKMLELSEKGVDAFGIQIDSDLLTADNIATLLDKVDPTKFELNFQCCQKCAVKLIELLAEYFKKTKVDLQKAKGSINFDPVGNMLKKGKILPDYLTRMKEVVKAGEALPKYRVLAVNTILLNNAGAYIAQELGYALAWGNDLMEKMTDAGFSADEVAKDIKFNMGIGSNYFMEIAKFRAARMLWAQIISQYEPKCGCSAKMKVNAETSRFNMTIFDANVNMLRTQTESMSAALANVDSIVTVPYDVCYKEPDDFSERIARNQQLLLKEESHLNRIVDPSAGSYYIENLTIAIAQEAWKLFLQTEDEGGFIANVENGKIQEAVNASAQKRMTAAAQRKENLLGTNQFPNFNETAAQKIEKVPTCTCCGKEEATIPTLNTERLAEEFETIRLATEKAAKQPKAFMLTIGNLAMRLARAQFSCNFFGCAGYKNIDNLGFETVEEGVEAALKAEADIIVLCSSDDEYAELAPKAKELIGDKAILVIAGAPACMDDLKAIGIDNYINVKSNVLETLKAFNEKLLK